ncbi:MAG: hypothetical protein ACRDD1_12540, partial [Planctomycetia bacterium]
PPTPEAWDAHFAVRNESDPALKWAASLLANAGEHKQAVEMLKATVRRRGARPWLIEALALGLQLDGAEPAVVRDCLASLVELTSDAGGLTGRWQAAAALSEAGQLAEATKLLRETATAAPGSVNTLALLVDAAEKSDDVESLAWAGAELLGREWPGDAAEIHGKARLRLREAEDRLRTDGKSAAADRLAQVVAKAQERDLVVTVSWAGEADVDVYVIEPGDVLCSPPTPRTTNGGVLTSDGLGTKESYVVGEAVDGPYEIVLKPIWGTPTNGTAAVDVVRFAGTPRETRERHTVKIDPAAGPTKPVTVALKGGRRREPAVLSPDVGLAVDLTPRGRELNPRLQLRQLLGQGVVAAGD